jgi:porphobilinogen synthase
VVREAEKVAKLGIPSVILFGLPEKKDEVGSEAWHEGGVVQRALKAIKKAVPELVLAVDACFCEYTTHGHCGVVVEGEIDNDATLDNLGRARCRTRARAPTWWRRRDDGRLRRLPARIAGRGELRSGRACWRIRRSSRRATTARSGRRSIRRPAFGDRAGYQMDPANVREAMRELALDVEEGADIVMVKPALAYLDVIAEARSEFDVPIAAYNVSGEYAMLKAAAEKGWIDYDRVMMETLLVDAPRRRRHHPDVPRQEAARLLRRCSAPRLIAGPRCPRVETACSRCAGDSPARAPAPDGGDVLATARLRVVGDQARLAVARSIHDENGASPPRVLHPLLSRCP